MTVANISALPDWIRIRVIESPCPMTRLSGDCWLWQGRLDENGYGQARGTRVHLITYRLFIGETDPNLTRDHLCRVRNCCNPWHLEEVTTRINILRGIGLAAINAAKTHCKYGHPLTPKNTAIFKGPHHGRALAIERSCRYL